MKVITESILRDMIKIEIPKIFIIKQGSILTPAGREYLNGLKIKIEKESSLSNNFTKDKKMRKYKDYITGEIYTEKPENMTEISPNILINKDNPRIQFRGKLDSLQSLIVLNQSIIYSIDKSSKIISDLSEVLNVLRNIMSCEILEKPFSVETIIGLTEAQLREHSHYPKKYYGIEQMLLPDYKMGYSYSMINQIRTAIREIEVYAIKAFKVDGKQTREDIIKTFNRLSSTLHIMMCKYLSSAYD